MIAAKAKLAKAIRPRFQVSGHMPFRRAARPTNVASARQDSSQGTARGIVPRGRFGRGPARGPTLDERAVVLTVSVEVIGVDPSGATAEGEKEHDAPAGKPLLQLSSTAWLNPLKGLTVMVYVTD